jgi:pyruvate dehydrogenase E1 component alpha subunit
VDKVRANPMPYFIEATTYRFMGHSMSDPAHGHYRTKEEVDRERQRDPLLLLRQTIIQRRLGTEADFKKLEHEVGTTLAAAIKFADESPFPDISTLHEDIYV